MNGDDYDILFFFSSLAWTAFPIYLAFPLSLLVNFP